MTREEAIKLINGQIYDCEQEICQDDPLVRGCKAGLIMALGITQQIDEPKCNHCKDWGQFLEVQYLKDKYKWHKVLVEGLPKEEGTYIAYFCDCVYPELCYYFKENREEIWNWKGEGLYWFVDCGLGKISCCEDIILWQKIEEYKND